MTTAINPPTDPRHLGRFFYLLLSICAMLVLLPVAEQFRTGVALLMCGVYATMWFAIHAVSGNRRQLFIAMALGLPVMVLQLLATFVGGELSRRGFIFTWLAMPLFVAFWFYITLAILRAFLAADVFTRDKLCGAICVFLSVFIARVVSLYDRHHESHCARV